MSRKKHLMLPYRVTPSPQTLRFRSFRPVQEDFEAVVDIYNACWESDPASVEQLKATYEMEEHSAFLYRRVMAELDGEIVAYAIYREVNYAHVPGKYEIQVNVHPDYRSEGIGRYLFEHVVELLETLEPEPRIIMVETRSHHTAAINMIESMPGFELVMRHKVAVLDVNTFDFKRFAHYEERMKSQNIAIRSLREIASTEPDWRRKFYELYWKAYEDVPMNIPATRVTYDDFLLWIEHPCFTMDGTWIAVDEISGVWAGLTVVMLKLGDSHKLHTDLTGVLRSHRRMGLATALKLKVIQWAHRINATSIETDNEEHNPMFQLNLHMGFKSAPAWLTYEKRVDSLLPVLA
jgi:mycothiol synthase